MYCWNNRKHGQFYNSTHRILQTDYEAAGIRYYTRDDGTAQTNGSSRTRITSTIENSGRNNNGDLHILTILSINQGSGTSTRHQNRAQKSGFFCCHESMKGWKENACGKRPHKKLDCGKQKVQKTIEEWELTRQCHMRHGRWGEWDDSICWKPRTSCRRCCTACNLLSNEAPCFQLPFLRLLLLLLHHPCLCPLHCRMHPCRKKASKQHKIRRNNRAQQASSACPPSSLSSSSSSSPSSSCFLPRLRVRRTY